jgi:hypothetical protein
MILLALKGSGAREEGEAYQEGAVLPNDGDSSGGT